MKKLFFASAFALFGAMNAQEYKPTTGDVTVEFGLTGGLNNTSVGFAEGGAFKARYFTSDNLAYRGIFVLSTGSENNKDANTKTSDFGFKLGFGMEKHFTGTERLSPYVGGDVVLGYFNNTQKTTVAGITGEQKGPSSFNFGVRGVFGADYYFAKRVFLGVEAGLGIGFTSTGKTTTTALGVSTSTKGGSSFNIKPELITGIRLGYAF